MIVEKYGEKMKDLYLMRHGQTLFNKKKMLQGWCDAPLTELGIEQAKAARELIKDIKFDHYYSSSSERASDTLEIVTEGKVSYTRLKSLKERNFYEAEGDIWSSAGFKSGSVELFEYLFKNFEGETKEMLQERIYGALTDIMEKEDHKCVLAVSHGNASYCFLSKVEPEKAKSLERVGNCSIMHFSYDNHTFKLIEILAVEKI